MSKVVEIGSLDGRLCGELAAALARRVTANDTSVTPGLRGASFYHDSTTAFEATTETLTGFGLLAPVPRDDRPGEAWYCLHALIMDADDMPNALAAAVFDGDKRLRGLLEAFLCVFCYYDHLSDRRDPFEPPQYLIPSMAMLARAGYAERTGGAFRWTALIGPAMREAGLWDETFSSTREAEEQAVEADARLAWRTMPETLKRSILSGRVSFMEMTKILALGWRDGAWRPYRLDDNIDWRRNEFPLAKRVLELAERGE